MNRIDILKANESHVKLIWNWRNDPVTKKMSLNNHHIEWEEHRKWFNHALNQNQIKIYIAETSKRAIGLTRFDKNSEQKNTYDISINMAPNMRRKGFGKLILGESIKVFLEEVIDCEYIKATIKKENFASNKLFSSFGFKLESFDNSINILKLNSKCYLL